MYFSTVLHTLKYIRGYYCFSNYLFVFLNLSPLHPFYNELIYCIFAVRRRVWHEDQSALVCTVGLHHPSRASEPITVLVWILDPSLFRGHTLRHSSAPGPSQPETHQQRVPQHHHQIRVSQVQNTYFGEKTMVRLSGFDGLCKANHP